MWLRISETEEVRKRFGCAMVGMASLAVRPRRDRRDGAHTGVRFPTGKHPQETYRASIL